MVFSNCVLVQELSYLGLGTGARSMFCTWRPSLHPLDCAHGHQEHQRDSPSPSTERGIIPDCWVSPRTGQNRLTGLALRSVVNEKPYL